MNLKDRYDRYFLALSLILYIPAFTVAIFYALTNFNGTKFVRSLSNSNLQAANELGHNFDDHCSYFCFLTKRTTLSFIEFWNMPKNTSILWLYLILLNISTFSWYLFIWNGTRNSKWTHTWIAKQRKTEPSFTWDWIELVHNVYLRYQNLSRQLETRSDVFILSVPVSTFLFPCCSILWYFL